MCSLLLERLRQHKAAISIYVITFLVVLPALFTTNLHSPYHRLVAHRHNSSTRLDGYKDTNDLQFMKSRKYLTSIPTTSFQKPVLSQWDKNAQFKLLVTVVAVNRGGFASAKSRHYNPKYLTQVVARYAYIKLNQHRNQLTDIRLLLCDADLRGQDEVEQLSSYAQSIHIHKNIHTEAVDIFEQEKLDYSRCLNQSLIRDADYILMVEDDALPHEDLLDKIDHLFLDRLPRINNTFGYIKLFHPSGLNGYITADVSRLLEWLALAGLLEHLLTLVLYMSDGNSNVRHTSISQRLVRYTYFVLILLAVGRINVLQWRSASPYLYRLVPAPSCCAPAMLFTPIGAERMVNYLDTVTCKKGFAKDTVMELTGLTNLFYEPKLYTHIGVYSTRHKSLVDPIKVD